MKREDRRAAVAAYKERKVEAGVYGVRCLASGQRWAGATPDLSKIWNRLCFSLTQGLDRHPSLQAAWTDKGAAAFAFEIIESVDLEGVMHGREQRLKDRLTHWCATLPAERL